MLRPCPTCAPARRRRRENLRKMVRFTSKSLIFRVPHRLFRSAAGIDIEIFGLASTSKFVLPGLAKVTSQIWVRHVTLCPKKGCLLNCEPPLPPASAGQGRIEPKGRHADVAERPNNFCRHLHDPPSDPSYGEHSPTDCELTHKLALS